MALIGHLFTDLGWIRDEAEDDAPPPARQSPFSPDQSSPDSSLIRRNHVAIPSTVTRLSQTCPLYPSIYIYIVTSPISFPASEKRTTSSKASVYTLGYFQRSQCNQTGIGQRARRGFDRNSPRQRNCIRFSASFTRQLSLIIIEQQSWMLYEQVTRRWIIAMLSIPTS